MANFEGQKIEFIDAEGKRRRFTVGSPEFKVWFDEAMMDIVAEKNRLEAKQAVIRELYGSLEMPLNMKTGAPVKSGTVKGDAVAGKFDIKTAYELIDNNAVNGVGRSQQAMLKAVHELTGDAHVSVRFEAKETFHKITESEKFAELGIDIKSEGKVNPSWKPVMLATVGNQAESESEVKEK